MSCVEAVLQICLGVAVIAFPGDSDPSSTAIYAGLSILASIMVVYFSTDSVMGENWFYLVATLVANAAATAFVLFYFVATLPQDHAHDFGPIWYQLRYSVVSIKSLFFLGYCGMVYFVYTSFAYLAYHAIGSTPEAQRAYFAMLGFTALLRIDLCLFFLLLICQGFFLLNVQTLEFGLGCAAFAVSCVVAFTGWLAVTNERLVETIVFMIVSLFVPAYVGWSLWNVWTHPQQLPPTVSFSLFGSFGGLFVAARVAMLWQAAVCTRDFNKGIFKMLWADFERSRRSQQAASSRSPFLGASDRVHHHHGGGGGGRTMHGQAGQYGGRYTGQGYGGQFLQYDGAMGGRSWEREVAGGRVAGYSAEADGPGARRAGGGGGRGGHQPLLRGGVGRGVRIPGVAVSRGRMVGSGGGSGAAAPGPSGQAGGLRSIGSSRETPAPRGLKEIGSVGSQGRKPGRLRRMGESRASRGGSGTEGMETATSAASDSTRGPRAALAARSHEHAYGESPESPAGTTGQGGRASGSAEQGISLKAPTSGGYSLQSGS